MVDQLETAAFGAVFAVIASRAYRGTWLFLGLACVAFARGWLLLPAGLTMALAFISAFSDRTRRRVGAAVGALGVQVVLRWPAQVFHGFPTVAAVIVLLVLAISAWRRSSKRVRRRALWIVGGIGAGALVLSIPMVVAVLLERSQAAAAEQAASAALSSIGSGSGQPVRAELRTASADAIAAASALNWWFALGSRVVPIVAQQDRFLSDALRAAASTAQLGATESPYLDYHRLNYRDGQINLVRLGQVQRPMQLLNRSLLATNRTLKREFSPWLVGPLQARASALSREVSRATKSSGLAATAATALPNILGGDGVRHYFVAFMTPSESRGLDGIVAAYGELTADNGKLTLTRSGSVADLDTEGVPPAQRTLSGPADYLARYGAFQPQRFAEDATYSPDLPTVAQVIAQLYPQEGGGEIDGVLALDPYGLSALLKITGPISVTGLSEPLSSANAASFLLKSQYTIAGVNQSNEARRDFLQLALQVAFHKLVSGSLPAPRAMAQDLSGAVSDGRIQFWSLHREDEPLITRLGLSGSFPKANGGDLLAVTTQDQGNNKLDAYLHTSVSDRIGFDPSTGQTVSQVTIDLRNDVPSNGLPAYVTASPADPGLDPGTNRTWLTIYTPLNLSRVLVDGTQVGASTGAELGVKAYSLYVDVPPDVSKSISLSLSGSLAPGRRLSVKVRLQPSANPTRAMVLVHPLGAATLANDQGDALWKLSSALEQERWFRFSRR